MLMEHPFQYGIIVVVDSWSHVVASSEAHQAKNVTRMLCTNVICCQKGECNCYLEWTDLIKNTMHCTQNSCQIMGFTAMHSLGTERKSIEDQLSTA